ncbi:MAG: TRAM domain-containing protein [Simkaniaceae bacterium]|nr:TRAM domain-containing protein [Simkaniaceae bacterium]
MSIALLFLRILFMILSIFFMTTYMLSRTVLTLGLRISGGIVIGVLFGFLLMGFDALFRRFTLRTFNITIIGLFIGYLMGLALTLIFNEVTRLSAVADSLSPRTAEIIGIALFLFGTYLGGVMTLRAADELYVTVPFVKFTPATQKKRDLLVDTSTLADARIIDLCLTGILDRLLIIPRFVVKELYGSVETGGPTAKARATGALEVVKKMEEMAELDLRFSDTDFPEVRETHEKSIRLARLLEANLLTADTGRVRTAAIEGVRVVNLHSLSNALKPLMETGEVIRIKVQRHGKEPRQGVGYLDDGTMVVINGGGSRLGETIDAQVLSVKHTSSGRMIFCNTMEDESVR